MALHLVGETIDAKRAHQRAQSGELIQPVRGVYVDDQGNIEATILGLRSRPASETQLQLFRPLEPIGIARSAGARARYTVRIALIHSFYCLCAERMAMSL